MLQLDLFSLLDACPIDVDRVTGLYRGNSCFEPDWCLKCGHEWPDSLESPSVFAKQPCPGCGRIIHTVAAWESEGPRGKVTFRVKITDGTTDRGALRVLSAWCGTCGHRLPTPEPWTREPALDCDGCGRRVCGSTTLTQQEAAAWNS